MAYRWLPFLAVDVLEHAADIKSPTFVNTFVTAAKSHWYLWGPYLYL